MSATVIAAQFSNTESGGGGFDELTADQRRTLQGRTPVSENGASRAGATWAPVDLTPTIEGKNPVEPPSIFARSDEATALLYPGKVHSLQAEPEAGKGWFGLGASAEVLTGGRSVLYIDFEDDPTTAVERLTALGVPVGTIADRFHYVRPDEPLSESAWTHLAPIIATGLSLAVIDGVTNALTLDGKDLRDNAEVAEWLQMLPRRLQTSGAPVLLNDHVVKDKEARGRYAIGAQHKLAGVDVAYSLKVREPFGRDLDGLASVLVKKDRPGHVRRHAVDDKREYVADLRLLASDGDLRLVLDPPTEKGELRPTFLMEKLSRLIEDQPGIGKVSLRTGVNGSNPAKETAIRLLIADGFVRTEPGVGRTVHHQSNKPYRAADDEGSE